MTEFLAALTAFLKSVPEIIKIFKWIRDSIGERKLKQFLSESVAIRDDVEKTIRSDMSVEEKVRLRREALDRSRRLWRDI